MSEDDDVVEVPTGDILDMKELGTVRLSFDKLKGSCAFCPKHECCLILEPVQSNQRIISAYCFSEEELKNITVTGDLTSEKKKIRQNFDDLMSSWEVFLCNLKEAVVDNRSIPKKLVEETKKDIIQLSKYIFRAPIAIRYIIIVLNNMSLFNESFIFELIGLWESRIPELLDHRNKNPIDKRTIYEIEFYFGKFLLRKLSLTSNEPDFKKLEKALTENYNSLKCYTEDLIK